MALQPYENPKHPGNGPDFQTGELCEVSGCLAPAGTFWDKRVCAKHNAERMSRKAKIKRLTLARFETSLELTVEEQVRA